MNEYKKELSNRLLIAVQALYSDASLINYYENDKGFFCDFDIPPLNPAIFSSIVSKIDASGLECFYEPDSFSGVYEDGGANNRVLQRIYINAFKTAGELAEAKQLAAEAAQRDHKMLGREMKLFSGSDDIGQGLILWHPKGAMLRYLLEQFAQAAHILNGYQWVYSPHIGRAELWKTSGHLDFYKESMYNPIVIDDEEYYLKPMNCPFHILIYKNEVRSYRELPIKYAEFGSVYRYELSGTLHGLTRVRGFTQDDAHIICTPEQIEEEVANSLKFSLYILRSFGLEDFTAYISTKPKTKFIGSDAEWEMATEILKNAVVSSGLDYKIDDGGGAFYGPKIDLKLNDALGREWQCSTIQFDFNLPARFDMSYIGSDGRRHTPYMVHRALFGSLERFIALLIEHYKGDFPFWLAPVQFGIVPIKECHNAYAGALAKRLRQKGFRISVNDENADMKSKIKTFTEEKIPYIIVIGDREAANDTLSLRGRKEGNIGAMDIEGLCEYLKDAVDIGRPRCVLD